MLSDMRCSWLERCMMTVRAVAIDWLLESLIDLRMRKLDAFLMPTLRCRKSSNVDLDEKLLLLSPILFAWPSHAKARANSLANFLRKKSQATSTLMKSCACSNSQRSLLHDLPHAKAIVPSLANFLRKKFVMQSRPLCMEKRSFLLTRNYLCARRKKAEIKLMTSTWK